MKNLLKFLIKHLSLITLVISLPLFAQDNKSEHEEVMKVKDSKEKSEVKEEKEPSIPVPASINGFSVETGLYSASSTSAAASGIGLLGLEYLRVLNMKWGASFAYTQLLSQDLNFSSSVYGFDLLAHYCFKTCRAFNLSNDPTGARYFPKWSYILQFGLSQKMIQLEDTTIGYNGIRIGGEASYLTQSPLNWFGRIYYSRMINKPSNLDFMAVTIGGRWWF